jgi:hypothetical protein
VGRNGEEGWIKSNENMTKFVEIFPDIIQLRSLCWFFWHKWHSFTYSLNISQQQHN